MGCNFGKLKSNDVVARKYSAASEEDEKNKEPTYGRQSLLPAENAETENEVIMRIRNKRRRNNVVAESVDVDSTTDVRKVIEKSDQVIEALKEALAKNFFFSSLEADAQKEVVDAMEPEELREGDVVIRQGDNGDKFFAVYSGSFVITVDEKEVSRVLAGGTFGELALLYNCPRAATVTATLDSLVYTLDRVTFRNIIARSISSNISQYEQWISTVPILQALENEQRRKIAEALETVSFRAGDTIIRQGEQGDIFYIIHEGQVVCTRDADTSKKELLKLGTGEFFGERALLMDEPRAANVVAETDTTCMALDREAFNELLGPLRDILDHELSLRVLKSVPILRCLNDEERLTIAKAMTSHTFADGEYIISQGEEGDAFYIIKWGNAIVNRRDDSGTLVHLAKLGAGDFFGEMALSNDEPRLANVIAEGSIEVAKLDKRAFTEMLGSLQDILDREIQERKEYNQHISETRSETKIAMSDLEAVQTLGTGTFGRVKLMLHKSTNKVYAMKCIHKSKVMMYNQQTNVRNERDILMQLDHPFILKLYRTFQDSNTVYMLMELVQGGEVFGFLQSRGPQPTYVAQFISGCVLLAFEYVHSKSIVYRDLKPENLLIDTEGYVKVVDFGFAKRVTDRTFTLCGTPEYLAPELVLGKGHNKGVDYWALGVLIYEIYCGYSPFCDMRNFDQAVICRNIVHGHIDFPSQLSDKNAQDIIKKLLTQSPVKRLGCLKRGAGDIKAHRWYRGFEFEKLFRRELEAPWVPPLRNALDTSHFDPYEEEENLAPYRDDGSGWDRDF